MNPKQTAHSKAKRQVHRWKWNGWSKC